jgi:hypothetical protein
MLDDWRPLVFLGGFVALLGVVAFIRVRKAARTMAWVVETMDGSTRWVGGAALVPGALLAILGIIDGVEPPTGVVLGLVCALGSYMALLGALGMEGVLLEKESEAAARIAERRLPPSSPRGRIVALVLGVIISAASVAPLVVSSLP